MHTHTVSVVIPVYGGEHHLAALVNEIAPLVAGATSPDGHPFRVGEVVLVHDRGPDDSARVIRELAQEFDWVNPVWLSRNFGQHPATLAGMASAGGDWIATMDEDGQHDPADLGVLLDVALRERAHVVYASPTNEAPHAAYRRVTSWAAKRVVNALSGGRDATQFHSYRLILGEIGRSVAAYAGPGTYLDVALGWVADRTAVAPVAMRSEGDRVSGYHLRALLSHFWRMVISSGTRALRLVSILGAVFSLLGIGMAVVVTVLRLSGIGAGAPGWASLMVVMLVTSGLVMFFLGVVAEYVGVAVNMAMGKPLFIIVPDEMNGPLGRTVTLDERSGE